MLKSNDKFHSVNGKRLILVADDEIINRMLLGEILSDEFEVIYAEDGTKALEEVRQNKDRLSLILLDIMMPELSGMEVLRVIKSDPRLSHIPVMVVTSDQESEIESLSLGASDFISKPFPPVGVILARVRRTIELSEDRQIIQVTERDALTGLYHREFFFSYADQFDLFHADMEMDAVVVDIQHFHMINERFGREYGDEVLRRIGERLLEMIRPYGGIVCRKEADTFLIYCPHRDSYEDILESARIGLTGEEAESNTRVRLRMGIYSRVDKTIDMERRFDRAKLAADKIRGTFVRTIAYYDNGLHDMELYAEQLIDDFKEAISSCQFKVYYQPKFDIRGDVPVLCSAEALVRWIHPKLGMISPGTFIPLFEKNGMILELDHYVWREAARQVREWRERFGISLPVSVNVSRVDMYEADLIGDFEQILKEFELVPEEYVLEITESAYTEDSETLVEMVQKLRDKGFKIEMDDFGTGYSSLGMLSNLPIDALKLDMIFVRNAFNERQDVRMLELVMGIAEHLAVPVIAEGVETKEQMLTLKALGCDIAQGYYFSKPVPAQEFERFVVERSMISKGSAFYKYSEKKSFDAESTITYVRIAQALAADYFSIYYVNTLTDRFLEFSAQEEYEKLGIEKGGDEFFSRSRRNIMRVIHEEDQEMFLKVFTKENVMSSLEENGVFSMTYRLMINGTPNYVHMKAMRMEDKTDHHIVIGVSSIDAQMRRDQELANARMIANRDPLTGVKSKHAFTEAEKSWNSRIENGTAGEFAVAILDVNGLKEVNDTQGHKAGDEFLRNACMLICKTFQHSPVYRIGGDEFAAILSSSDYECREQLRDQMCKMNSDHLKTGEVLIACGLEEYQAGTDTRFENVFERADTAMYENKKMLKDLMSLRDKKAEE